MAKLGFTKNGNRVYTVNGIHHYFSQEGRPFGQFEKAWYAPFKQVELPDVVGEYFANISIRKSLEAGRYFSGHVYKKGSSFNVVSWDHMYFLLESASEEEAKEFVLLNSFASEEAKEPCYRIPHKGGRVQFVHGPMGGLFVDLAR